jgi:hypothetical protein
MTKSIVLVLLKTSSDGILSLDDFNDTKLVEIIVRATDRGGYTSTIPGAFL